MKIYGDVMPFTEEMEVVKTEDGDLKIKIHNDNDGGIIYLNKSQVKSLIDSLTEVYNSMGKEVIEC